MGKRGMSQLDWALSLAIFILYIGWFFIFVQPTIDYGLNKDVLGDIIKDNFEDNFSWTLSKLPIFIFTDNLGENRPILFNMTTPWTNFDILNEDFVYIDDDVIVITDINQSPKTLWLVEGTNYSNELDAIDLIVTQYWASTSKNISVNFDDSLYDVVIYGSDTRFQDAQIYINDLEYQPENVSYNDTKIAAIYQGNSQTINHTSIIYSKNSIIDVFVEQNNPNTNLTYKAIIEVYNYSNYYSSNQYYGFFNSSEESKNVNYSFDRITFYDNNSVSFSFDRNTSLNLDYYNNTVVFEFEFTFENSSRYKIDFHDGNYLNFTNNDYSVSYGIIEEIEGLSLEKLKEEADYTYYKSLWNYPGERHFSINVWNSTKKNTINETKPLFFVGYNSTKGVPIVYSDDVSSFYLSEDLKQTPVVINIKVW